MPPAAAAVGLIGASAGVSALQARQEAKQSAAIAKFNQQVATQQAEAREKAGKIRVEERKERTRRLLASQTAAYGASGVAGGRDSPLISRLRTAEAGALDALTEQFNVDIGVQESLNQAELFRAERKAARSRGRLGVGAAIFGGAAQIATVSALRPKTATGRQPNAFARRGG
jgi:hypothetical protein